jgi:class 3 adenylate cyclase
LVKADVPGQTVHVRETPKVHFTTTPDEVHLAYQAVGTPPPDLLLLPAEFISIDMTWEEERYRRAQSALAGFARLLRFDRRGVGLSDPVPSVGVGAIDRWVDDAVVVLDAAGSQTAAILGTNEGGLAAMLFAALHPDRTSALILFETYARVCEADDYSIGWKPQEVERFVSEATAPPKEDEPGFDLLAVIAPSVVGDGAFRSWWERAGRHGASPATARALWLAYAMADLREVLPSIQAPTLVLHRTADAIVPREFGDYLAARIPDARFVELPGVDNLWWVDPDDALMGEIEEFLTGVRSVPPSERVLATVLFTDIVSSTPLAAGLGDRRWRDVLEAHTMAVRSQVERFGGHVVKSTGDGVLATFDGPGRAIRCAQSIQQSGIDKGFEIRCGLHTGEIEVMGDDIGGIAVHIAARVASQARGNEVLVSSSIPPLVVGSGMEFSDQGEHDLKGVPGPWRLFAVIG